MKKRAVISLSGGMDSTSVLLHLLANGYEVKAYSFWYNQKHQIELQRVKENINRLMEKFPNQLLEYDVLDVEQLFKGSKSALTSNTAVPEGHYAEDNQKITVVPGRNSLFMVAIYIRALIWSYEDNSEVVISLGAHKGDFAQYKDCSIPFFNKMTSALEEGNDGSELINSYSPYLDGDKFSILQDAVVNCEILRVDFDTIFKSTNTCYNPDENGKSCGRCGSCIERSEAFINIGKKDPVEYVLPWEQIVEHTKEVLSV